MFDSFSKNHFFTLWNIFFFCFSIWYKAFLFTWDGSYVVHTWILVTALTNLSHKSIYVQFFFPAGGSPWIPIYALETHKRYKICLHYKKYFCSVQINSWTFTPWLTDNSWKLHMHETLRAGVFTSTCCVCMCVCVCVTVPFITKPATCLHG